MQNCAVLDKGVFLRRKVGLSCMLVDTDWYNLSELGHLCMRECSASRLFPFLKSFSLSTIYLWLITFYILVLFLLLYTVELSATSNAEQQQATKNIETSAKLGWKKGRCVKLDKKRLFLLVKLYFDESWPVRSSIHSLGPQLIHRMAIGVRRY